VYLSEKITSLHVPLRMVTGSFRERTIEPAVRIAPPSSIVLKRPEHGKEDFGTILFPIKMLFSFPVRLYKSHLDPESVGRLYAPHHNAGR
jgi:hypothetical protein